MHIILKLKLTIMHSHDYIYELLHIAIKKTIV